jgi:oligoribonuclease
VTHAPTHQFLWLAIETTHTDPAQGVILEVAAALAEDDRGGSLEIVHEWHAVTDEPWFDCAELDDAVVKMHTDNGLFEASATATLATVEGLIVDALVQIMGKSQPTGVVLAGLTAAWTLPWIKAHMPRLASCLAFGVLDVGSLNRAAKAWHPEGFKAHWCKADRAQAKVHAALASAAHWRQAVGL